MKITSRRTREGLWWNWDKSRRVKNHRLISLEWIEHEESHNVGIVTTLFRWQIGWTWQRSQRLIRDGKEQIVTAIDVEQQDVDQQVEDFMSQMKAGAQQHRAQRIAKAENDPNLFCYGCAHSAGREPFPGKPSGERPCCFCVRNKERRQLLAEVEAREKADGVTDSKHPVHGYWYDGSPAIHVPMDCYCTIDMKDQQLLWKGIDPDTTVRVG